MMKFGNWLANDSGIEWKGNGHQRFVIGRQQLLETEDGMYSWVLRATGEDWLTDDDLYDFNFAFVYAAARAGNDFDYEIFDRTLDEQYDMLEEEANEHPDLSDIPISEADKEQQRKDAMTGRD
jgi:hypothetical protein